MGDPILENEGFYFQTSRGMNGKTGVPWKKPVRRRENPIGIKLINPVWSLCMIFGKTRFILFAMQPDAILYDTFNSVIGFHFRNCRGLSPFGSNVISPSFCGEFRLSVLKLLFIGLLHERIECQYRS